MKTESIKQLKKHRYHSNRTMVLMQQETMKSTSKRGWLGWNEVIDATREKLRDFLKYFKVVIILLMPFALTGCADYHGESVSAPQRMFGKQKMTYNGTTFAIIEVDGVEYLCEYHGGICHLVKK